MADRLVKQPAKAYYVSPMGRARETAAPTLERLGREEVICPWMREFLVPIERPDVGRVGYPWDMKPGLWTQNKDLYDREAWYGTELMRSGDMEKEYKRVTAGLDKLLAAHGYVRDGEIYRAERPNTDTVVLFCHFGVECVFLAHLLGVSPVVLWHGTCALPTSVTTLVTEERDEKIAAFRMLTFGDVSHLTEAGEEPSFSARFCEVYSDFSQRH